jgi:hypothetical protein
MKNSDEINRTSSKKIAEGDKLAVNKELDIHARARVRTRLLTPSGHEN